MGDKRGEGDEREGDERRENELRTMGNCYSIDSS